MVLNYERVEKIAEQFSKEYTEILCGPTCVPNSGQVSIGISNIKTMKILHQPDLELKDGESLEDLCLSVGLTKKPQSTAHLPQEYQGVRVFYKKIGKIVPL